MENSNIDNDSAEKTDDVTDKTAAMGAKENRPTKAEVTDYFLVSHVIAANNGLSFSITLNVGGILISGLLIGGKEYFQEFGRVFQDAHPNDPDRTYEKSIQALGDIYDGSDAKEPPLYIHLKDAKFYSGGIGSGTPKDGALWRGRISSVDGFILGSFQ